MWPLYQYEDHEPALTSFVESIGPRSKYAISFGAAASVKSNTEVPPWYQPCTRMSRPGIGMSEPLCETHVTISLSSEIHTGSFEASEIAQTVDGHFARGLRVQSPFDELARPHLDVKGKLLVDLLIERHAPQPRTQRPFHVANTFETPVENFRHVAISAASCSRPA